MKKIGNLPLLVLLCVMAAVLFILITRLPPAASPALPEMEVYFVDVGSGDCTAVRVGGHVMVIDAGPADVGNRVAGFIVSELGERQPEVLVITHDHVDHTGGLNKLMKEVTFGAVYASSYDTPRMTAMSTLFASEAEEGTLFATAQNGTSFMLGEAKVTLLRAEGLTGGNENDRSVAVKIEYGQVSFLIAADLEAEGETALVSQGEDLHADVLRVAHHGADTSTTSRFLKAVSPSYAVVSVGKDNDYGHPSDSVLSALSAAHCSVWITRDSGTVRAVTDGVNITPGELYERPEGDPAYVGNRKTMKFHTASCPNVQKMSEHNKEFIFEREDAVTRGFIPGGCCNP